MFQATLTTPPANDVEEEVPLTAETAYRRRKGLTYNGNNLRTAEVQRPLANTNSGADYHENSAASDRHHFQWMGQNYKRSGPAAAQIRSFHYNVKLAEFLQDKEFDFADAVQRRFIQRKRKSIFSASPAWNLAVREDSTNVPELSGDTDGNSTTVAAKAGQLVFFSPKAEPSRSIYKRRRGLNFPGTDLHQIGGQSWSSILLRGTDSSGWLNLR